MKDNTRIFLTILLTGIIILSPYALRIFKNNPYDINSESYYNIRISEYDSLQERTITFSLLNILQKDNLIITKILPLFLAILCVGLIILIMKKHNIVDKNIMPTILILIASPAFIYTFVDLKYFSYTLALSLLFVYFLVNKKNFLSAIPLIAMPFFDYYSSIIAIIFINLYLIITKNKNRKTFLIIGLMSLTVASITNFYILKIQPILPINNLLIITDITGEVGFSFSMIILSIIGIILLWEKGLKNFIINILIILLLILSTFSIELKAYMVLILSLYAGFAFSYLKKRKWSIQIIKKVTMLLIVCSIVFTTVLYISKLSNSNPTNNDIDALKFLKDYSFNNEKILSSHENGFLIQYYANRPTLTDQKTKNYEPEKMKIYEEIIKSRNLEKTETLLKNNNIKYFYIDKKFKKTLEEKEGLLFLLEQSKKFQQIYKNQEIEIWMHIG
ncbi:MAG: hypothetical protein QXK76_03520 [Candidatus Woesearchaeota archaeon]